MHDVTVDDNDPSKFHPPTWQLGYIRFDGWSTLRHLWQWCYSFIYDDNFTFTSRFWVPTSNSNKIPSSFFFFFFPSYYPTNNFLNRLHYYNTVQGARRGQRRSQGQGLTSLITKLLTTFMEQKTTTTTTGTILTPGHLFVSSPWPVYVVWAVYLFNTFLCTIQVFIFQKIDALPSLRVLLANVMEMVVDRGSRKQTPTPYVP